MSRTFHRRPDAEHIAMAVIFAALALFFFLQRRTPAVLLALLFVAEAVVTIERLIHTVYALDEDAGELIVDGGRFSRTMRIPLSDIVSATCVPRRLLRPAHVLVRYGAGHECAVCPENGLGFAAEIMRCVTQGQPGEAPAEDASGTMRDKA